LFRPRESRGRGDAAKWSGGGACPPPLRSYRQLWGRAAVDVLVEPAGVRTRVSREAPVGILRATLVDVGAVRVAVAALTQIRTGDHVPPIGPGAVRERPDRTDVEIVATERGRPAAELLPVRIARDRAQPRRRRPDQRGRRARRAERVERRNRALVRAVPDRPRRAVAGIVAAVPPDRVHAARVHRDVREALQAGCLRIDQYRRCVRACRAVQPEEVDARLAADVLVRGGRQIFGDDRTIRGTARHLRAGNRRVVDHVEVVVHLVLLVRRRAHLGAAPHERVARIAGGGGVTAIADHRARAQVGRVVRLERLHDLRRREARAAVRRSVVRDCVRGRVAADVRELAVGHVDVSVAGHRDVRELDVVHRLAQLHRARERPSVVGRADEVDARVEAIRATAREARPREVDVAVALAAGAVDLERRLIVEFPQQVRRRRALRDVDGDDELLAVFRRRAVLAVGVLVRPDPHVAECLGRAFRIARALRAGEQPAVAVPREHRIARISSSHVRTCGVRRLIALVPGDKRTGEGCPPILRTVVAEPNVPKPDERPVRREHAAVVIRAADDHLRVPRVDRDGGLVLPATALGACRQDGVRVRGPGDEREVTRVPAERRVVVREPRVVGRIGGESQCNPADHSGCDECAGARDAHD
jgi:hypothetical protein